MVCMATGPDTNLRNLIIGPTLLVAFAWLLYTLGVTWRFWYILFDHRATNFIFSDMQNYAVVGMKMFNGTPLSISDTIWSPGASLLFGYFGTLSPAFSATMAVQFFISAAVPVLLFLLTRKIYGRPEAYLALVFATAYFPFVEFSAYFLSEIPFLAVILLALLALINGLETPLHWKMPFFGFAAGLLLGIAVAFRSIALVPGAFALIALLMFFPGAYGWTRIGRLLLFGTGGFGLAMLPLMFWCSSIAGFFCIGSTNAALTTLQGHWYPGISNFYFHDLKRGHELGFGPPTLHERGIEGNLNLYFGPYDQPRVLLLIHDFIIEHPRLAFSQSVRNVKDLYWGTVPWPSCCNAARRMMAFSQWAWLLLLVIPTLAVIGRVPKGDQRENRYLLLLIAPIIGITIAAFLTLGDPRYRIPFDFIFMIIAAHGYVLAFEHLRHSFQTQKSRRVRAGSSGVIPN